VSLHLRAAVAVLGTPGVAATTPHAVLVDRLVAQVLRADLDPDLSLLAYAAPDAYPHKCVATYLNHLTGGKAHSAGLTGQGLGAPFTALRVADAYARTGQSSRPMIVVVESAAPASGDRSGPTEMAPELDSGVLLAFGVGDEPWTVAEVAAFETRGGLTQRLRCLARAEDETLYVLGPALDDDFAGDFAPGDGHAEVHRVQAGSYCTSVWLALASHWDAWSRSRRVIALCETDPLTGASHLAVLLRHADGVRSDTELT
jgi:hypothetical protein